MKRFKEDKNKNNNSKYRISSNSNSIFDINKLSSDNEIISQLPKKKVKSNNKLNLKTLSPFSLLSPNSILSPLSPRSTCHLNGDIRPQNLSLVFNDTDSEPISELNLENIDTNIKEIINTLNLKWERKLKIFKDNSKKKFQQISHFCNYIYTELTSKKKRRTKVNDDDRRILKNKIHYLNSEQKKDLKVFMKNYVEEDKNDPNQFNINIKKIRKLEEYQKILQFIENMIGDSPQPIMEPIKKIKNVNFNNNFSNIPKLNGHSNHNSNNNLMKNPLLQDDNDISESLSSESG